MGIFKSGPGGPDNQTLPDSVVDLGLTKQSINLVAHEWRTRWNWLSGPVTQILFRCLVPVAAGTDRPALKNWLSCRDAAPSFGPAAVRQWVPVAAATKLGIVVANTPNGATTMQFPSRDWLAFRSQSSNCPSRPERANPESGIDTRPPELASSRTDPGVGRVGESRARSLRS